MKTLQRLKQRLSRLRVDDVQGQEEASIKRADERLHEQATRLHVLEWEAYGHPRKRRPKA